MEKTELNEKALTRKKNRDKKSKPLSLHPLDFEKAVKVLLKVDRDRITEEKKKGKKD